MSGSGAAKEEQANIVYAALLAARVLRDSSLESLPREEIADLLQALVAIQVEALRVHAEIARAAAGTDEKLAAGLLGQSIQEALQLAEGAQEGFVDWARRHQQQAAMYSQLATYLYTLDGPG
jgi:hypothetical protein